MQAEDKQYTRVRSGCLTCRGRKVKCDETRPACRNCVRLARRCAYGSVPARRRRARGGFTADAGSSPSWSSPRGEDGGVGLDDNAAHVGTRTSHATPLNHANGGSEHQLGAEDPFSRPDSSNVELVATLGRVLQTRTQDSERQREDPENGDDLASSLISRDIQLTTTMDLLATQDTLTQPLLDHFLHEVECPGISPYDPVSWQRFKNHAMNLAVHSEPVGQAVTAVTLLSRTLAFDLPMDGAVSMYDTAKSATRRLVMQTCHDFELVLVVSFLLCHFEWVHSGQLTPFLNDPGSQYLDKLSLWARQLSSHTALATRLSVWLRVLHSTSRRGGCMGLVSHDVAVRLQTVAQNLSTHTLTHDEVSSLSTHVFESLAAPCLDFYVQLQLLSGDIAEMTHYHRSRTSSADQQQVLQHTATLKARLKGLWEGRCTLQRSSLEQVRSELPPNIAVQIVNLLGICNAAYNTEFIELDRVLGDPVSKWTDSRPALEEIKNIVDFCASLPAESSDQTGLNPGFLRPLFLCAIECTSQEQNQWAVDNIAKIQPPVYRSAFFAAFGKAIFEAQVRKERRVTTKYFSTWLFGAPPPFL